METAVPVALDVADVDLAGELGRHVERTLGWQVVEDSPDLPARLRLTDDAAACQGAVLVRRTFTTSQVQEGLRAGAREVLSWPADAARLAHLTIDGHRRVLADIWTVAASAGGVGASTVSLAIAAALAWSGRDTVWIAGVEARRMTGLGSDRVGVISLSSAPGLHVATHLRDVDGGLAADAAVVVDVGIVTTRGVVEGRTAGGRHTTTRTLVGRPDAALIGALGHCEVAQVVTVGSGGLRRDEMATITRDRTHVHLEWSFRVARAALRGRLPGAFPGAYLGRLSPLTDAPIGRSAA